VKAWRRAKVVWRALLGALRVAIDDELQRSALAHVQCAPGVRIRGSDRVSAGRGVFIDHRAYLNASTVNGRRGFIHIGDYSEIGPYCVLWGGGGLEIGKNVHLGAHVHVTTQQGRRIPDEQSDPSVPLHVDCAPVVIEDHVLIYSGAIIVPGVRIGHHARIAAGSVVIGDVPAGATVAGVPARRVSPRRLRHSA
jgi:tetrahydrodipicolinate N-acetyltransferase